MNVAFIGLGRMGFVQARIARHFGDSIAWGVDISVLARREFTSEFGVQTFESVSDVDYSNIDLIWITVTDANIEATARCLKGLVHARTAVFHTSGAMDCSILKDSLPNNASASFHPLLPCPLKSVSDMECVSAYRGAFHAVDGDEAARYVADKLVQRIGGRSVCLSLGQKARYHAAAVMASNYPIILLEIASQMFVQCGFEPHDASDAVRMLCSRCLQSYAQTSFDQALTGPVKRKDFPTIERHERVLEDSPLFLDVYDSLKRAAFALLEKK